MSERRAGATSYLHGGDKNAEARTSSTGAVTGTRSYDAFGGTLASTGWTGPAGYGGAFGNREDGTSFRLVGHRLYDPTAGRFLSRDPARDGANWYLYCGGDPVNGADPTGLYKLGWGPTVAGAAGLVGGTLSVSVEVDHLGNVGISASGGVTPAVGLGGFYAPTGVLPSFSQGTVSDSDGNWGGTVIGFGGAPVGTCPVPIAGYLQGSYDDGEISVGGGGALGGGVGVIAGPVPTVSRKLFNIRDAVEAVVDTVRGWFT